MEYKLWPPWLDGRKSLIYNWVIYYAWEIVDTNRTWWATYQLIHIWDDIIKVRHLVTKTLYDLPKCWITHNKKYYKHWDEVWDCYVAWYTLNPYKTILRRWTETFKTNWLKNIWGLVPPKLKYKVWDYVIVDSSLWKISKGSKVKIIQIDKDDNLQYNCMSDKWDTRWYAENQLKSTSNSSEEELNQWDNILKHKVKPMTNKFEEAKVNMYLTDAKIKKIVKAEEDLVVLAEELWEVINNISHVRAVVMEDIRKLKTGQMDMDVKKLEKVMSELSDTLKHITEYKANKLEDLAPTIKSVWARTMEEKFKS